MDSNNERIARLEQQVDNNKQAIERLVVAVAKCVTMERYRIVEIIALGLAALVLVPVVSMIVAKAIAS